MISINDITAIGRLTRSHGIDGEMVLNMYPGAIDLDINPSDLRCIVLLMDNIPVPFFLSSTRVRGNVDFLITIDGVTSAESTRQFIGKDVYALNQDVPESAGEEEWLTLEDLIGYSIIDTDGTCVGRIVDVDDSTENVLFSVKRQDESIVDVPAAEPLITDVNTETQTIVMDLPKGLY